jgi:Fur family peroxide stress response transcriptional regulator
MQRFEQVCRRRGLRVTHQRMEIFRDLAATDEHPDAETIYRRVHRRIPAVSLDTVYRTLGLLEEQGLARKAEVHSGSARYDANMERHHHFVCSRCGLVRDVAGEAMKRIPIPRSVKSLGVVKSYDVQLRGVCRRCLQKGRR